MPVVRVSKMSNDLRPKTFMALRIHQTIAEFFEQAWVMIGNNETATCKNVKDSEIDRFPPDVIREMRVQIDKRT